MDTALQQHNEKKAREQKSTPDGVCSRPWPIKTVDQGLHPKNESGDEEIPRELDMTDAHSRNQSGVEGPHEDESGGAETGKTKVPLPQNH